MIKPSTEKGLDKGQKTQVVGQSSKFSNNSQKELSYEKELIQKVDLEKIEKELEAKRTPAATELYQEIIHHPPQDPREFKLHYEQKLYDSWIQYFTQRSRSRFIRYMNNGMKYKNVITSIFKEHGLPEDLFYIGLIESGYYIRSKSHANAVGPWQFIKGTARMYGLRVDNHVDERMQIHKATHAAARFLNDLYNIFGSWELALAAYNAGENRIIGAIRKGNVRDYLKLVEKKLLPRETRYYIPKVAAARDILKDPQSYGLPDWEDKGDLYANVVTRDINHSFSVNTLAKHLKIPKNVLVTLNTDIKKDSIKVSSHRPLTLYLPQARALASNDLNYMKVSGKPKEESGVLVKEIKYKVGRGESLWSIADKFGLTIEDIKKRNNISANKIFRGQRIVIPEMTFKKYQVKNGDNLFEIARKFNTTLTKIIEINALQTKVIHPEQELIIPI